MKRLLLCLLALCLLPLNAPGALGEEDTPYDRHGPLRVEGGRLVDSAGAPVQLRGVSTHGLNWYPQYVSEKSFRTLRDDWGVSVVRLAMFTADYAGYLNGGNQASLLTRIDMGVQACTDLGLYAIIDWHILNDGDPTAHQEEAKVFFREMASRYGNLGNVLYEICNEPNGPVAWSDVRGYAEAVLPEIRAYAPEAVVLCGTPTWSQDVDAVAASPLEDDHVMYVLHFYAATHGEGLRRKLQSALKAGTPVFITECGIGAASGDGRIDYDSAAAWKALIDEHGLSYVGWNLSNKDETSAFIRPDCSKTCDWKVEDLSETGVWLREALRSDREREDAR